MHFENHMILKRVYMMYGIMMQLQINVNVKCKHTRNISLIKALIIRNKTIAVILHINQ